MTSGINQLKSYLIGKVGDLLELVILEGSYGGSSWINGWSDIDLLIAVKDLGVDFQKSLPELSKRIGERFNVPVSLDAVTLEQLISPKQFLFLNQSKTIQAV